MWYELFDVKKGIINGLEISWMLTLVLHKCLTVLHNFCFVTPEYLPILGNLKKNKTLNLSWITLFSVLLETFWHK